MLQSCRSGSEGSLEADREEEASVSADERQTKVPTSRRLERAEPLAFGGRFRLKGLLAEGGMGNVYRAWHASLEQPVAIKILHEEYRHHPQVEALFAQEARMGARLRGPHVTRVFDFGHSENGAPYIVSELLEGIDLRSLLERVHVFTVDYALKLFLAICEAVQSVHEQGVIHRDIKPGNLFLASEGKSGSCLKLLDFGIAKVVGERDVCEGRNLCLGSPMYMAPEQKTAPSEVDPRADIWSMGVVLYEMLTGKPLGARPGVRRGTGFDSGLQSLIEPPSRRRAGLDSEIDWMVLCCLEEQRERRIADVTELRRATERLLSLRSGRDCGPRTSDPVSRKTFTGPADSKCFGTPRAANVEGIATAFPEHTLQANGSTTHE